MTACPPGECCVWLLTPSAPQKRRAAQCWSPSPPSRCAPVPVGVSFGASGVRFGGEGFVEVLAATQTPTDKEWFQGTADAVRQYSWLFRDIKNRNVEDIVILSGDHLYRMDYMKVWGCCGVLCAVR